MRTRFLWGFFLLASWCNGQTNCQVQSGHGVGTEAGQEGIKLDYNSANLNSSIVNGALAAWNTCTLPRPQFETSGSSSVEVRVKLENGPDPNNVGMSEWSNQDKTITLYTQSPSGSTLSSSDLVSALTHELGHVLGLGEVSDSSCLMGPYTGSPKVVGSSDCIYLSNLWAPFCTPQ